MLLRCIDPDWQQKPAEDFERAVCDACHEVFLRRTFTVARLCPLCWSEIALDGQIHLTPRA